MHEIYLSWTRKLWGIVAQSSFALKHMVKLQLTLKMGQMSCHDTDPFSEACLVKWWRVCVCLWLVKKLVPWEDTSEMQVSDGFYIRTHSCTVTLSLRVSCRLAFAFIYTRNDANLNHSNTRIGKKLQISPVPARHASRRSLTLHLFQQFSIFQHLIPHWLIISISGLVISSWLLFHFLQSHLHFLPSACSSGKCMKSGERIYGQRTRREAEHLRFS